MERYIVLEIERDKGEIKWIKERDLATNSDGGGFFEVYNGESGWTQHMGTCQFYAKDSKSFMRQLRKMNSNLEVEFYLLPFYAPDKKSAIPDNIIEEIKQSKISLHRDLEWIIS